jgi:hypothetical protein
MGDLNGFIGRKGAEVLLFLKFVIPGEHSTCQFRSQDPGVRIQELRVRSEESGMLPFPFFNSGLFCLFSNLRESPRRAFLAPDF